MRFLCILVFAGIVIQPVRSQENVQMYRYASSGHGYEATSYNLVFDTKAWQFDAGSPVRSTPLVSGNDVYFGTAGGDFIALDKKTGQRKWTFHTTAAIHSSAALQNDRLFFADNSQTVYAVRVSDGKLLWTFHMGKKIAYPWRFDYYYSSPLLTGQQLVIGGDDGYLYKLNQKDGKPVWKFKANGLIRSTPVLFQHTLLFGTTEATFYAVDNRNGTPVWEYKITGDSIRDENYGYDKRAITSSPVVANDKVIFGARDAFLYCLDAASGRLSWKISHEPSWILSTAAVKDSFVITGTSDGRFVQAVNFYTGHEIWKHHTPLAVWSSPLINNNRVYAGGYDGQLLVLDLLTGKRISEFLTNGMILSSPVINDRLLYIGSDDGNLYALRGRKIDSTGKKLQRLLYYTADEPLYFRNGGATRIKHYLVSNGFTVIGADSIAPMLTQLKEAKNRVVVIAGAYLPKITWENGSASILRQFLDAGGRLVLAGNNPLFFDVDDSTKRLKGLSIARATAVLGIDFGPNDTRAFGGLFPGFPTETGKLYHLPDYWVSNFGLDSGQVDIILGKNENGQVSAFVKKYPNGGRLVQLWLNPDLPVNLDAILKLCEEPLE